MKLVILALVISLCGCAHVKRERSTSQIWGMRVTSETTSVTTLFKKGEAGMLNSWTIETDDFYVRLMGIEDVKTGGDSEAINATGSAAGALIGEVLKKTSGR